MYKLVFYVPINEAEKVKNAVFSTGAGTIGHYGNCSWETPGIGQFKPLTGSNPAIGLKNKLERVEELRVEILCTEQNINAAVSSMKKAHPYEVPAYEVLSVLNHMI